MLRFSALLFLLLAFEVYAVNNEASIKVASVQFIRSDGIEAAPSANTSASIYFVLKNTGNSNLKDIVLNPLPGKCVKAAAPYIHLSNLMASQVSKVDSSIAIIISPECKKNNEASILLFGGYTDSTGARLPLWTVFAFKVGE